MSLRRFRPGISVIVPTYRGGKRLPRVLESLLNQTLDHKLFEVLFVLNGPDDGSRLLIEKFREQHRTLNIRVLTSTRSGAGIARNIGLASVLRQYVTFLDDDDAFEPRFLEVGLKAVRPKVCALLPIVDVVSDKHLCSSSLALRTMALKGTVQSIASIPWVLGFNACKIISSETLLAFRYPEDLQSGEDVVFFAHLLATPDLKVCIPDDTEDAGYLRTQREGSVSRQNLTFDFCVAQRLKVISRLRSIEIPAAGLSAMEALVRAQFSFIERFLTQHPNQLDEAITLAVALKIDSLDWEGLRADRSKKLVISYCFPPYADPSANAVAKTIANQGELVDVIHADMSQVRKKDASTSLVVEPFVGRRAEIAVAPSFSSWPLICAFARRAAKQAESWSKTNNGYEKLYSRALWSASHVASCLVKLQHPAISWEAEFSDPLRYGISGDLRVGKITPGFVTHKLKKAIRESDWAGLAIPSHFVLTELATFILADRIVFTNDNQRSVMLSPYPQDLQEFVVAKSVIRNQIKPSRELFSLGTQQSQVVPGKINIGYFGSFYRNRGIGGVVQVLEGLDEEIRNSFVLHVYCSDPESVNRVLWESESTIDVRPYPYLNYLDFLASSDLFDVLLVADAFVGQVAFGKNPFLPSKYADYCASNAPVWGIVQPGSPLSEMPLDFVSSVGDDASIREVLFQLYGQLG
ncbi:glycosyltransferase [Corynebacterium pseudogenitalium]|uniref:glycosyltransferase n=1 Tax=Corynebacterium pseudogenitalium TaxID=38303 RepID=UPI00210E08EB|nr:glycosyltransferase [Corynebacterium pseudogenitalium]UUA86708.1 glycosyltransferase [Corynebacterium pseudogenitalium]